MESKVKVFICYAREDVEMAKRLYDDLERAGVSPWLDRKKLLPGQNWKRAIKQAMKESAYVLTLLSSHSVSKQGYIQKELKEALDLLEHFPPSKIFIIPARLDKCKPVDERLQDLHRVDLFESYEEGLELILQVVVSDRKEMPGAGKQESVKQPPKQNGQPEHVTQKGTNKREAHEDYFEHVERNVYTGPVTIHQHVSEHQELEKQAKIGAQQEARTQQETEPQPKEVPSRKVQKTQILSLRSEPVTISEGEAQKVFRLQIDNKLFDFPVWRPSEYINNDFEVQGDVVIDHVTGLIWQKAGSENYMTYEQAQKHIEELNRQQFAGYKDWRLPTIPELMSLLEPEKQSNNLYINPILDATRRWYWSADLLPEAEGGSSGAAWLVSFHLGDMYWLYLDDSDYVRCVCSR